MICVKTVKNILCHGHHFQWHPMNFGFKGGTIMWIFQWVRWKYPCSPSMNDLPMTSFQEIGKNLFFRSSTSELNLFGPKHYWEILSWISYSETQQWRLTSLISFHNWSKSKTSHFCWLVLYSASLLKVVLWLFHVCLGVQGCLSFHQGPVPVLYVDCTLKAPCPDLFIILFFFIIPECFIPGATGPDIYIYFKQQSIHGWFLCMMEGDTKDIFISF